MNFFFIISGLILLYVNIKGANQFLQIKGNSYILYMRHFNILSSLCS